MMDKKIYVAMLVLLITVFALAIYFASSIELVNILLMPILFCMSKLLSRLGLSLYHATFEKDLKGLIVFIVALVLLLIYDWNKIVYWFLIGTVVTLLGMLICRGMYKRKNK